MPNTFAYILLFSWPFIAWLIFKRSPDKERALVYIFIIPYLFLPVKTGIDPPGLPPIYKNAVISWTAFALYYSHFKNNKIKLLTTKTCKLLIISFFLFPIFTVFNNKEAIYHGFSSIQGLAFSDLINLWFQNATVFLIPLFLGAQILHSEQSHKTFIRIILTCGLIYSILICYEIRMSPQLHAKVYGFFPHAWDQHIRKDGFRPIVFLEHGLLLAIYLAQSVLIAASYYKPKTKVFGLSPLIVSIYLAVVLFLSKNLGALVYVILFTPLLVLFAPRRIVKVTFLLGTILLIYPIWRSSEIFPDQAIVNFFEKIDSQRASSLNFRLENEEILLNKANEKPFFGWGTWGRNRVYDPVTGEDLSITDGYWIIVLGSFGWIGYITILGMMSYPILLMTRYASKCDNKHLVHTSTLCVLLGINLIDFLPNAPLTPISMLMAGAIIGLMNSKKKQPRFL